MTKLYNMGLRILLLHLVIDINVSNCSLFSAYPIIVSLYFTIIDLLFFANIIVSIKIIF